MLSLQTAVKSGTAILLTSFMLVTLSACSEPGGPVFAQGSETPAPVVKADSKVPFDNTDVYKGSAAEKPAKIAMVVENFYREVASHEVRDEDKQNQALEDTAEAKAQKQTYAGVKEYVYQGSLSDAAAYDFFRSLAPKNLPAASGEFYTYEILLDKSKVHAGENNATVSFEDSYSVLNKVPTKITAGTFKDLKMVQINGEWLIDIPSTLNESTSAQ